MRGALEALATQEAVPELSSSDVAYLKIKALIADGNLQELRILNFDLHMRIYQAANLPQLYRTIRVL